MLISMLIGLFRKSVSSLKYTVSHMSLDTNNIKNYIFIQKCVAHAVYTQLPAIWFPLNCPSVSGILLNSWILLSITYLSVKKCNTQFMTMYYFTYASFLFYAQYCFIFYIVHFEYLLCLLFYTFLFKKWEVFNILNIFLNSILTVLIIIRLISLLTTKTW